MAKKLGNLNIANARIFSRNFSGNTSEYNRSGTRQFCVAIDDPEQAQMLMEDGWNVKARKPRSDDEEPGYYLPVAVQFNPYPPTVYMITKIDDGSENGRRKKTLLTEKSIANLDGADILNVDLVIRPRVWVTNEGTNYEKSGIKAYLKAGYFTIEQDAFAAKYSDLDDDYLD